MIAELNQMSSRRFVSPFCTAIIYLGLGDKERALDGLENAYEVRSQWLPELLKVDRIFDPLRTDPRFIELLKKVHLDKSRAKFRFADRVTKERPVDVPSSNLMRFSKCGFEYPEGMRCCGRAPRRSRWSAQSATSRMRRDSRKPVLSQGAERFLIKTSGGDCRGGKQGAGGLFPHAARLESTNRGLSVAAVRLDRHAFSRPVIHRASAVRW